MPMLDGLIAGLIEKLGDHLGMREPTPEVRERFEASLCCLSDSPVAEVSLCGSHDVEVTTYTEEVTFHSDGSYRLPSYGQTCSA